MEIRTSGTGLKLDCIIADDVPDDLVGDPARLRQVVINLVGNSVKFTETGGITLRVEKNTEIDEPGGLRISVSDTGIGIPKDKLGLIFEKFSQADASTTRKYGGTGLGLAICTRITEMMGGSIWAESEEGEGSSFIFTPVFKLAESAAEVKEDAIAAPAAAGATGPLKILLVDDAPQNRKLILAYLKKTPHEADTAENGQMAYDMFVAGDYDIVLMDVQMPVMDGYTATRKIREWEAENGAERTPVLALTAHALNEEADKSKDAGCDAHLTKPIKKPALLDALDRFAKRPA
jgi:CheY-like chemotaxis protein